MKRSELGTATLFKKLGLKETNAGVFCGEWLGSGKSLKSLSPINGKTLATVRTATADEYERVIQRAQVAFQTWQNLPAPRRGEKGYIPDPGDKDEQQ